MTNIVLKIYISKHNVLASEKESAIVIYLMMCGIFTLFMFFGTLRINRALQVVFGSLVVLFFLLAIGDATDVTQISTIAGIVGIFCGASAIYTGMAIVLNDVYGKTVMPLGLAKKK